MAGTDGVTFHQGVGFLEAKEGWAGGTCVFDSASSIADQLCPQNVLTSFSGPGAYGSGGPGQSPNSTFITVAPVPEDLTTVTVRRAATRLTGSTATTLSVKFVSTPPAVASSNNFVAAPIQSLTYGISRASSVPQPGPPVPGDITVPTPLALPPVVPIHPRLPSSRRRTKRQRLCGWQLPVALLCPGLRRHRGAEVHPDCGKLVHLLLHFPHQCGHGRAVVVSGPTLSPRLRPMAGWPPPIWLVKRSPRHSAAPMIVLGSSSAALHLASATTPDTGNLTSSVDTSKTGPQTFTVNAVDAAGKSRVPRSITQVARPGEPGHRETGSAPGETGEHVQLRNHRGQPGQSDGVRGHRSPIRFRLESVSCLSLCHGQRAIGT